MSGIGHYEAIRKEVIWLLRMERESRRPSNYAVAQRSGVSESMLSLVERGVRNPTMELMLWLAYGMRADLGFLIQHTKRTIARDEANRLAIWKGRLKRKAYS
jgi:transcriptional regulator with XRE-family HTH domain